MKQSAKKKKTEKPKTRSEYPMRINKYLAQQGYYTRKDADIFIEKGKVFVNGKKAHLGQKISKKDVVEARVPQQKFTYLVLNKPRGVVTHSPQRGEQSVLDFVHTPKRVFPIGRLDKDSEGLILLTDDARITKRLLEPVYDHEKEYDVHVDKPITNHFIKQMSDGVAIEGYTTKKASATKKNPHVFSITLTEGKKHQIRRMCAALGYQVQRLRRTRIMNIHLGKLKPGSVRELQASELSALLTRIGLKN